MSNTPISSLQELKKQPGRFCPWMRIDKAGTKLKLLVDRDGKALKGSKIAPGSSKAFSSYRLAIKRWLKLKAEGGDRYAGVSVILGEGIGGIDLDEVRDKGTGKLSDVAFELIGAANTYAEVSPSGTGVKMLFTYAPDDVGAEGVRKAIYLEKKRTDGRRQEQIDPNIGRKGQHYTLTGDVLPGHEDTIRPIQDVLPLLARIAREHGIKPGRPKGSGGGGGSQGQGEKLGEQDPPEWFDSTWRDDIPESLHALASVDPVFARLWGDGVKADKGTDTTASALDYSLVKYLADKVPAGDLPSALAHYPHGQVNDRIRSGDDVTDWVRRRMWRCIADHLTMIVTQDMTLARMFSLWALPRYRWHFQRKTWMRWTGSVWVSDIGTLTPFMAFFEALTGDRRRYWECAGKEGVKALNSLKQVSRVSGAEKLARDMPMLTLTYDDLDQDELAVNTPGGLIDPSNLLVTEKHIRPVTKVTRVDPDWESRGSVWRKLVLTMCGGDKRMARYLQRVAGKLLLGKASGHALFFIHGPSRSGKSVFVETLAAVFGDYAGVVTKRVLSGSGHGEDVLSLRGLRMAVLDELGHIERWDGATLKRLASSDRLGARPLYGRPVAWDPTHTVIVRGNDKPLITGADEAIAERIHLIDFNNVIPRRERDENLTAGLVENHGGEILAWALRGSKKYLEIGLKPPEKVLEAGREFVEENDLMARFIKEHVVSTGPEHTVSRYKFVREFNRFLTSEGCEIWSAISVVRSARARKLAYLPDNAEHREFKFLRLVELEAIGRK